MAELAEQAGKILGPLSGLSTAWAVDLGLRLGLFAYLAEHPEGRSAGDLAEALDLDPTYTKVALRAAYAGEILELDGDRYRLAEHMATLLLDPDAPAYAAGAVKTFVALRETYLDLRDFARTGQREWWSDFDPEWIDAVGENGQTYYRRMLAGVFPMIPGVADALERGARYLDLACGVCKGPAKVAAAYPNTSVTAVDCDRYTLEVAERTTKELGVADRFTFVESFLETLDLPAEHDLAVINISLHEARDIERAVARAHAALRPGGTFVVSEFPFPERDEECRTVPGRLMCGVQFFEAHIGCQLLPTSSFVSLLENAGFAEVGVIDVTPTHAVIHGTKR
jgi:SAM-dependent methyltransferase